MISFEEVLVESPREASTKKRKWEEPYVREFFTNQTKLEERKSTFYIDFNPETPFTSDNWHHYLTIQTARKIHRCEDSKKSTEPVPHHHDMSLELRLNLTPESLWNNKEEDNSYNNMIENKSYGDSLGSLLKLDHDHIMIETNKHKKDTTYGLLSSSSKDYKEMVATVCMQCHMLVMLCKSSPTCPSCKFMHPPDQNPSKFLQRNGL